MPSSRRTWNGDAYAVYWATGGFAIYKSVISSCTCRFSAGFYLISHSLFSYVTGSSLIGYGLSGTQAITACLFSPILVRATLELSK